MNVILSYEFMQNAILVGIMASILCGILICLSGLMASYFIELPSGASIILIGGALLGVIKGIKRVIGRRKSALR